MDAVLVSPRRMSFEFVPQFRNRHTLQRKRRFREVSVLSPDHVMYFENRLILTGPVQAEPYSQPLLVSLSWTSNGKSYSKTCVLIHFWESCGLAKVCNQRDASFMQLVEPLTSIGPRISTSGNESVSVPQLSATATHPLITPSKP